LQSKDKQTPKTFQQWDDVQESTIGDCFNPTCSMKRERTWNAATEATRTEYDDKIKSDFVVLDYIDIENEDDCQSEIKYLGEL